MKQATIFILGAGASVDYGLPTGIDLTKKIIQDLEEQEAGFGKKLARVLRRSRTPTIDHFVRLNEQYSPFIREAMAKTLWSMEQAALDPEGLPPSDWISWLYHSRLIQDPECFVDNEFVFLSFNYDRLPQALLATMMANTFDKKCDDCLESVLKSSSVWGKVDRFVHLHGALNTQLVHGRVKDPANRHSAINNFLTNGCGHIDIGGDTLARGMVAIGDPCNTQVNFHELYANAERVYLLGMGYHPENLERVGLTARMCQMLGERLKFFGGTGYGIIDDERERVNSVMGSGFVLGGPGQDCLAFLQAHLPETRNIKTIEFSDSVR